MRSLLPTLALVTLVASPMFAAKRIVMEDTDLATNKVTTREILVDADRLRVNDGDTSTMFLTKGGNRLVILDKKANTYQEIDQATMDQMGAQMNGAMAQMQDAMKNMPPEQRAMMEKMMKGKMPQGAPALPAATTFSAKGPGTAGTFRCTNYEGTQAGKKVSEICAAAQSDLKLSAPDFQVMDKMREYLAGMMKAMQSSPLAGMATRGGLTQEGINGFPVLTTTFVDGKATHRDSVKSVSDATFSAADFSTGTAKKADNPLTRAKGK